MSEGRLCYPLSAGQLRRAHDFDWKCCSKYLGTPLRVCSSQELDDLNSKESSCVSDNDFETLLRYIDGNWRKWSTAFEVECDTAQSWGWGLKMRHDYCLNKLYIPPRERNEMGWTSRVATSGPSKHLYDRSPIEKQGYMGGIISLANWGKTKVIVERHSGGSSSPIVFIKNVNLNPGDELLWNYGGATALITDSSYNPECCKQVAYVHKVYREPRLPRLTEQTPWRKHFCLLCGSDITSAARGSPSNFKEHYIKQHAHFFSSSECDIHWEEVLYNLEIFRKTIAELQSKHYHVSFCNVPGLLCGQDCEEKFDYFKKLFNKLKQIGVLLLKGDTLPSCPDDILPEVCTKWNELRWTEDSNPKHGTYVSKKVRAEVEEVDEIVKSRVCSILQHEFVDNSLQRMD